MVDGSHGLIGHKGNEVSLGAGYDSVPDFAHCLLAPDPRTKSNPACWFWSCTLHLRLCPGSETMCQIQSGMRPQSQCTVPHLAHTSTPEHGSRVSMHGAAAHRSENLPVSGRRKGVEQQQHNCHSSQL